jgi:NADH-quinone oxidoreductase subunit H
MTGVPSLLLILAISSCGVYGVLLAGWSSGSTYALLGALRAVAQMISYELTIGLGLIPIIILGNSFDLTTILLVQQDSISFFFLVPQVALIFFIAILAETNRAPFDLPEAEAELVAGYNVEYAAAFFAMFFLGEYGNIILMSSLFITLFFGGFNILTFMEFSFALKVVTVNLLFIFVRANLPRFRFDQLMFIC